MTPSVRVREYSPALAADYSNPPGGAPAAGNGLTGVAGLQQLSQKLQDQLHVPDGYYVQQQGSSGAKPGLPYNSSSSSGGPRSCKVYLDKAGDLFTPPDQAHFDSGLSRDVAGAKAEIPGWNYSRPFLTGAFLMQPDLLSGETAGDPPPDLGSLPAPAQEQALVNDLLHTFMGISGGAQGVVCRGPTAAAACAAVCQLDVAKLSPGCVASMLCHVPGGNVENSLQRLAAILTGCSSWAVPCSLLQAVSELSNLSCASIINAVRHPCLPTCCCCRQVHQAAAGDQWPVPAAGVEGGGAAGAVHAGAGGAAAAHVRVCGHHTALH